MANKLFREVFPDVNLGRLSDLIGQTAVTGVVMIEGTEELEVYIESPNLIPREDLDRVEEIMANTIFPNTDVSCSIRETFNLSSQYNLESIVDMYKDSLMLHVKHASHVDYRILKRGEWIVSDNVLTLLVEDTAIARDHSKRMVSFLAFLFEEKFGLNVEVCFEYTDDKKTQHRRSNEIKLRQELVSIERRNGNIAEENGGSKKDKAVGEDSKQGFGQTMADGGNDNSAAVASAMSDGNLGNKPGVTSPVNASNEIYGANTPNAHNAAAGNVVEGGLDTATATAADFMKVDKPDNVPDGLPFAGTATSEASEQSDTAAKDTNKTNSKAGDGNSQAKKTSFSDKPFGKREGGFKGKGRTSKATDPDVIFGNNVEGDIISISDITEGGTVCIRGQILNVEDRQLKNGKFIISATITDFTDTITFKMFVPEEDRDPLLEDLKKGKFYIVKGVPAYDSYAAELALSYIAGIKPINDFREFRMDNSIEKRVELHLHTVMSEMDSVVDIGKVIKRAKDWGHKAVAITDHGNVQAFPVANHCIDKNDDFKILYGVEGYFVDDLKDLILNDKGQSIDSDYVVFDIETTGLSPKFNKIIEIGAVRVRDGKIVDTFSKFINPEVPIPYSITKLTSINDSMVLNAPTIEQVLPEFFDYVGDSILVAHNASFDTGFIREFAKRQGLEFEYTVVDTLSLAHILVPELGKYTLDRLCKQFNVSLENHHRACDDADATARIFLKMLDMIKDRGVKTIGELNVMGSESPETIKKAKTYHGIILVKNEIGRVNLYRLISESHINYFNRRPRIPKSLINKYREGLIIGSACEAGELYNAVLYDTGEDEITRLCNFYDYYEIQPVGNNMFMIDKESVPVNSVEDIQRINRKIYDLGKQFNKPVVATCDVHFLDPEDEIYRRIIMAGKGFDDADNQPPLYFRTTEEMLEEFQYLGSDEAREVVITNTNLIADMIEKISPVRPDKQPPIIENSDETLTNICYEKAHQIYGPDLPDIVVKRLDKELNSIITNGFAVMYIIAQKLVWRSNDDGYLVGSRGSVGSSFVATMAGITEVNPLPAHYICPECFFTDFDSEHVKPYQMQGQSGCDMPDRECPHCGHKLIKEGHDIPFETFLGFKGDKEPDIDLNFSGEYQPKAHAYTEELFGKGKAFRAGTIGTMADKTAYGYVYNYYKDKGEESTKRRCEMERIAAGCTGVKRTTGQHPGGMIVLPKHEEIYSFTPIQKPANDMSTDIITTHFEYHSIDHNLLKLDILGHDDPTMIKRLEDLTGLDAKTIPLDDKQVMSLFHGTEALGIKPEDIGGTKLGSLGVPEFGTEFAMQMLIDADPQNFSDLVRIAGLSHGTDVWLGNAQTLIQEGKCKLGTAICTRDDIMIYLINMGLESGLAFTIMESVRKGKGLKPEWEEEMTAHGVPDWYIWSCKKIKYMFPKAHAAAYVMMGWRVAYYKVNYPLAYYTAFFSIRASAFDYKLMCQGKEALEVELANLQKTPKEKQTATIKDTIRDMKIVQEMYARGFEFMPIDLYKADAHRFQIIDNKIMPSFASIGGMGAKAAETLQEAAAQGEFMSKEDIRTRGKVSKAILDDMEALGLLSGLPETNQYDFFSLLN